MKKYCVKKNEDGTYKLAKKEVKKSDTKESPLSALDNRLKKEEKGK